MELKEIDCTGVALTQTGALKKLSKSELILTERMFCFNKKNSGGYKIIAPPPNSKVPKGKYGIVFSVERYGKDTGLIAKVQQFEKYDAESVATFCVEQALLKKLNGEDYIPKTYGYWWLFDSDKNCITGIIIMDKLDKILADNFNINIDLPQVLTILDKLHDKGIYHLDPHLGNFMRDKKGKIYIIDFGLAYDPEIFEKLKKKYPKISKTPKLSEVPELIAEKKSEEAPNYTLIIDRINTEIIPKFKKELSLIMPRLRDRPDIKNKIKAAKIYVMMMYEYFMIGNHIINKFPYYRQEVKKIINKYFDERIKNLNLEVNERNYLTNLLMEDIVDYFWETGKQVSNFKYLFIFK